MSQDRSSSPSLLQISAVSERPSSIGSVDWFTGTVVVDMLFPPNEHTPTSGGLVTFTPGARTAWHSHPVGQTLIVTSGLGWIQAWGEERREIKPGDVVWIPPNVKHWHGASDKNAMQHIALQDVRNGSAAEWMEQVDDQQYGA